MSIRKVKDWELVGMQAVTVLQDDFGNQHIVQTSMNVSGANHDAEVASAETVMQTNETNFVQNLLNNGWTQQEIDALKKP